VGSFCTIEVWEVEVSKERAIRRLVKKRNFTVTQAEERYQAVLVDPEMRRERVHLFISNNSSEEDFKIRLGEAWGGRGTYREVSEDGSSPIII